MSTEKLIMEEVIRLNNEGVWCLADGQDSTKALCYFKDALTALGAFNVSGAPSKPREEDMKRAPATRPTRPPALFSVAVPGMEDECLYVHNRAISLHSSLFYSDLLPSGDVPEQGNATSIIIFNLGLACQYHGTRYHDKVKLRNACELYQLCSTWTSQAAVAGETGQGNFYQRQISTALTLASVNNHGMILHRLLDDQERSLELMSQQMFLPTSTDEFAPSNLLGEEHYDEILLNILTVTSGMAVVVSAAA